jgi:hypothetical protein
MSVAASTKESEQKRKELGWFLSFQEKFSECPGSNPEQLPPPAPDLFFKDNNLGIEITQYLLKQGKDGSLPCRLENVREAILRMARSLYEARFGGCILVSVRWANDICPEKRDYHELARAISQAVATREYVDRYCSVEWEDCTHPLFQKYIDGISVAPIPGGDESCWVNPMGLCFGTIEYMVQSFQELLDKKRPSIPEYRKTCARVWLLIVADRRRFSASISAHEPLLKATFRSEFERVLVLDEHSNRVLELRITREHRQS